MVLNEAETADRKQSAPSGTHSSLLPVSTIEVIEAFGMLMERYPTAILDTAKLPRAKQEMKRIFMDAWRKVGDQKLRTAMEIYFAHLSQFQEGVGDTPVEFEIPGELRATAKQVLAGDPAAIESMRKKGKNTLNTNARSYNRYFHFSAIAEKEGALLLSEFENLKRRN